jgi:tetratricopeptide (TPR) repeat protein
VKVGGTELPAGSYGHHMLPTAKEWTVIFSREAQAWGSFSYDPKEDAARVSVVPVPAEATNRLAYTFDDPTENGVVLSLRWENLRVPVPLEVDTKAVVVASLREQLRGLPRFFPEGWSGAAAWCARNDVNPEEALAWADRSLALRETFPALRVKADLLARRGQAPEAEALRSRALALATEAEVNQLGYAALSQGKVDEALALFRKNVQDHPASWNTYDSLAEGYAAKGDKAQAIALYRKAQAMVQAADQKARIDGELAKLK